MDSLERPPDLAIQLALEPLQSLVSHGLGAVERELKALRREANNVQAVRTELTQAAAELAQVNALLTQRVTRLEGAVQGLSTAPPTRETTSPALAPTRPEPPREASRGPWIVATVAAVVTAGVLGYALPRPGGVRYVAVPTTGEEAGGGSSAAPGAVAVTPAGGLRPSPTRAEAAAEVAPVAVEAGVPSGISPPDTAAPPPSPPVAATVPGRAALVRRAPAADTPPRAAPTAEPVGASASPAGALAAGDGAGTTPAPPTSLALLNGSSTCGGELPCEGAEERRRWTRVAAPSPAGPPAAALSSSELAARNRATWVDASLITGLSPTDYCRADIEALPGGEFRLHDYGDCSLDCRVAFSAAGDPESLERCVGLGLRRVALDCDDAKRGAAWFRICRSGYLHLDGEAAQIRVSRKLARAVD